MNRKKKSYLKYDIVSVPVLESTMRLDADSFKSKVGFEMPVKKSSKIIVHCMIGKRAQRGTDVLKAMGFDHVTTYPGSFNDWKAKGGEIVHGS